MTSPDARTSTNEPPADAVSGSVHAEATRLRTDGARRASVADVPRLLYLTNRLNLNGILSSRIVGPRESFRKYYADLLDRFPGWVPLLTSPPSSELLDLVTSERAAGVAAIIEFPGHLPGLVAPADRVPLVLARAVPLSMAAAIHFPDERAAREHRARGYSNVHAHDELIRVTPELFEGSTSESVLSISVPSVGGVDWQRLDRIRGAVSASLAASESGEQLAMAALILGAERGPAHIDAPEWFSWAELADIARPALRSEGEPIRDVDHLVFAAAYRVLAERDASESWRPREVLDAVQGEIEAMGLPADAVSIVAGNLRRVREVLTVERDFEPFRARGGALFSAMALLLLLLRPDLEDLTSWPEEETGADDATRLTAALLSGRLRGLAREGVHLRSKLLDDATAAWAVSVATGADPGVTNIELSATADRTELRLGPEVLRSGPPMLPDPAAMYQALDDDRKEPVRLALARDMGWAVKTVVSAAADSDVVRTEAGVMLTTIGDVEVTQTFAESALLDRLKETGGTSRRRVVGLLRAAGGAQGASGNEVPETEGSR